GKERNEIIEKLARYTGLSKQYIDNNNLRIVIYDFIKELLSDQNQVAGRLDSRFKRNALKGGYKSLNDDPSYSAIYGPYTAAINHYIRHQLKYVNDIPYWPISRQVRPWNWKTKNRGFVNVAETLRIAINKNNYLRVLIANGYYDLATPYFATVYTVNHMGLPPSLTKNIVLKYYESGHMMYIRKSSLIKLRNDVYEFYTNWNK
ncbi:MAG: peptidase S10, partial [bacterium]|nr:peptidase S10 [bacterium]